MHPCPSNVAIKAVPASTDNEVDEGFVGKFYSLLSTYTTSSTTATTTSTAAAAAAATTTTTTTTTTRVARLLAPGSFQWFEGVKCWVFESF